MIGITVLKVTNTGGTTVSGIPSGTSAIFLEGQILSINLNQTDFRQPPSNSQTLSGVGPRARITSASIQGTTTTTFTASPTLTLELGILDNDGYNTVHLSSAV